MGNVLRQHAPHPRNPQGPMCGTFGETPLVDDPSLVTCVHCQRKLDLMAGRVDPGQVCNNRTCDNVLPAYWRGVRRLYCSEQCRWDCHHTPLLRRHDPAREGCIHSDFVANVEISRLFSAEVPEASAATIEPESLAITMSACCKTCGKPVRFEGKIGVAIGPGAQPMVSLNGLELRAAGHLGENLTPSITATMREVS